MKITLYESGYPCYPYDSKSNSAINKTTTIKDSADKMHNKLPPPLTIEECTTRRTQKDSADVKPNPKPLTFDDLETAPKAPIRTRQGDSMTTRVNKVVNTPVSTSVYIPLSSDVPQRAIAPLPSDSLQVMHPGAVLIECPPELKIGMNALKPISVSGDPNQILECHTYR